MEPVFFENVLLKFIFQDKSAQDKISPFLSGEIFDNFENKEIVKSITYFRQKFGKFPSVSDLKLHLNKKECFDKLLEIINLDITEYSFESLIGEVESFFKKKLLWNEIASAAELLKDDNVEKISELPDKLRTALSFSFDSSLGLNLLEDFDRLYDHLHNKDKAVPTGLKSLDRVIDGGVHEKTLTMIMGATNMGKTLVKCAIASNMLLQNKNVLYITLEMSEEKISERITQNLFDVEWENLKLLTREQFYIKFSKIKEKLDQRIMINEFPTKGISTNQIRNLLKQYEIKKKFKPDVVFIDYLGIMLPTFQNKNDNSYSEVKRISEEVRGLAVEIGIPFISSVQTNRDGMSATNLDLKDISDSVGTAYTCDILIGITESDELREQGKYCFIILKNRQGLNRIKITVNVNKAKSKVYDMPMIATTSLPKLQDVTKATSIVSGVLQKEKEKKRNKIISFE